MARSKNPNRRHLSVEDVLAGRGRPPSVRELIELVREVNPSGLDLPAAQAARRYAQKSRLQSLLIRRFESELEVEADPRDPGVVSLRYRPLDADACHAVLRELDGDARSWAQRQVDLKASGDASGDAQTGNGPPGREPFKRASRIESKPTSAGAGGASAELSLPELLRAGQEAIAGYEYDLARDCLLRAFEQALGGAEAALPLLSLFVDCLAADEEALALEARMAPGALKQREVRRLLALAAARCGERDRAESLLEGQRDPAAADVHIALARGALDAGDLDRAAHDVAQAREIDPMHAMLGGLEVAVTERRACERRPLEDELAGLVAGRRLDEAEAKGHALLARWPDSAAAQRALREIDELRKADRMRGLLAVAEEALARGEALRARSSLQQALAMDLRGEEAARIQTRIEQAEAAEQAVLDRAQEERAVRLLGASDLTPGLIAYAALDSTQRSRVRAEVRLDHLEWLDQMGAPGSGARARVAAAAVLALDRAAAIVAEQPEVALELAGAHSKMLQGVRRNEEVVAEARRRLDTVQKANAARRLSAVRAAFDAGAIDRARELLAGVPLGLLSAHDGALAGELSTRIQNRLEARHIEELRSQGALLRARQAADRLTERLEGEERMALEGIRQELGEAIRQAFRVQIHPARHTMRPFHDVDLRGVFGAPRALLPHSGELLVAATREAWVFLRLIDLASRTVRVCVTLRTPVPVEFVKMEIDGESVLLIGQFGCVLELSLADWTVMGWHEHVGFERAPVRPAATEEEWLPSGRDIRAPPEVARSAALVPGTRWVWFAGLSRAGAMCFVRIVDLARRRVVREYHEARGEIAVRALRGLDRALMMVVCGAEGSVALYEPHGAPVEGSRMPCRAFVNGIVAYPGQQRILVFTGNAEKEEADGIPSRVYWSVIAPSGGVSSENIVLEDMASTSRFAVAVDGASGMIFVRVATMKGIDLVGLRACGGGSAGIEPVFRVSMPEYAVMIQGWDGQGVLVLAGSGEGIDVIKLGEDPPVFRAGLCTGELRPSQMSFWGRHCHRPTGAPAEAVVALYRTMKDEPPSAHMARIGQAKRENHIDRLLELCYALELCGNRAESGRLAAWITKHHLEHSGARAVGARRLASMEQWSHVRDMLFSVDTTLLDEGTAQHVHHMLGVALWHLKEPDEALRVLKKGATCKGGRCALSPWIAICTPLPESPEDPDVSDVWTADQARIRMLMRAIQAADARLAQGDVAGARRLLDRREVLETYEVQSLARLAEVYLLGGEGAAGEERIDQAFVLASFSAAHAETMVILRRELPLLRNGWDMAKLDDVSARATQWLDANLGAAWAIPPGGF